MSTPTRAAATSETAKSPEYADSAWGRFHSQRFLFTVPLPDGKSWKIDDHTLPYLRATHDGTASVVTAYTSVERELVNHKMCEERARAMGLVPTSDLRTVESTVTVGPDAFDTRIWVAVETRADAATSKDAKLTGHIFLFGAYIRKCLFVHLATSVARSDDEPRLSARLASARVSLFGGLSMDPPRTTTESDALRVPPAK